MNGSEKCINCGSDCSLHHYQTLQCPVHGCEAPIGHKQEYMMQTFESTTIEIVKGMEIPCEFCPKKDEIIKGLLETCKNTDASLALALLPQIDSTVASSEEIIKITRTGLQAAIRKAEKGA